MQQILNEVRDASFPRLRDAEISIRRLNATSLYLEARFTVASFFLRRRLRFRLLFNQEALTRQIPVDGLRAIVAHELAHFDYYQSRPRLALLGLVRLLSPDFNARFERKTDLVAIRLGYGPRLRDYRSWLYANIPHGKEKEKRRKYFSPEEIDALIRLLYQNPDAIRDFARHIPGSLAEIEHR